MILDQPERFRDLDPEGMMRHIEALPDQLKAAWDQGQELPLPQGQLSRVLIAGMGGSAIAGDLLLAYGAPSSTAPAAVWRNYGLPGHAIGSNVLIVASSHSGNTEETLSAFNEGVQRGCGVLAVTTGGELAARAEAAGAPVWRFDHDGQPRSALGYSFGLLLAAFARMGFISLDRSDLDDAVEAMKIQMAAIGPGSPVADNLAKRVAGQLMGRHPIVIGGDLLAPVARRWRTQIAENAKALAAYEELPEADHNMIAGVEHPEGLFGPTMVLFLRSEHNHVRNLRRLDETRRLLMVEGFNTDVLEASGNGRLAQQWTALHLGDYVSYYLAMTYGTDPTPVPTLDEIKRQLGDD